MEGKRFIDHLEDLRGCILKSLIGAAAGFVLAFVFAPRLFQFLSGPYRDCLKKAGAPAELALRSLGPADTLQIAFRAALVFGIGIASPWIAYQMWRFVSPALHRHEKKYAIAFCAPALFFFLGGTAFAYFLVLPTALTFFYTYTTGLGLTPDWAIANYYDFVISFLVGFGLVFELPIAVVILSLIGIVTPQGLSAYRKHAIVGIFIVAGIFTPGPDIASQLMMGIPMVALYEISIMAARIVGRRKKETDLAGEGVS